MSLHPVHGHVFCLWPRHDHGDEHGSMAVTHAGHDRRPWSGIDPSPNERGGLGQCRGFGRADSQVQIQMPGRPAAGPKLVEMAP